MSENETSLLTISFKTPQWVKDGWSNACEWLKYQDPYEAFFILLGGLVVAPIAGGFTRAAYEKFSSGTLVTFAISMIILVVVGMTAADSCEWDAKRVFWTWIAATAAWYVTVLVGIVELSIWM